MTQIVAIWKPAWYELDQGLVVGKVDTFLLITSCSPVRFATDLEQGEWYEAKIISIHNEELGNIIRIDTEGLSYKFYFTANDSIQIEAEETPGKFETGAKYGQYLEDTVFNVEVEIFDQDASASSA